MQTPPPVPIMATYRDDVESGKKDNAGQWIEGGRLGVMEPAHPPSISPQEVEVGRLFYSQLRQLRETLAESKN